jgi:hypothetical protein
VQFLHRPHQRVRVRLQPLITYLRERHPQALPRLAIERSRS